MYIAIKLIYPRVLLSNAVYYSKPDSNKYLWLWIILTITNKALITNHIGQLWSESLNENLEYVF
jgi:hypothetical protein